MRILACADQHGRQERIARVRALVAEHAPDVVVLPGDLTHAGSGQQALALLTLSVPVLAVAGNMDGPAEAARIRTGGNLDGTTPVTVGGISFGGPAVTQPCDVLVVHEPPYGTLDVVSSRKHIGSQHVLQLMQQLCPRVLLCGHVHESPGIERSGGTLVINCSMGDGKTGGALIEIGPHDVQARLLSPAPFHSSTCRSTRGEGLILSASAQALLTPAADRGGPDAAPSASDAAEQSDAGADNGGPHRR